MAVVTFGPECSVVSSY